MDTAFTSSLCPVYRSTRVQTLPPHQASALIPVRFVPIPIRAVSETTRQEVDASIVEFPGSANVHFPAPCANREVPDRWRTRLGSLNWQLSTSTSSGTTTSLKCNANDTRTQRCPLMLPCPVVHSTAGRDDCKKLVNVVWNVLCIL